MGILTIHKIQSVIYQIGTNIGPNIKNVPYYQVTDDFAPKYTLKNKGLWFQWSQKEPSTSMETFLFVQKVLRSVKRLF